MRVTGQDFPKLFELAEYLVQFRGLFRIFGHAEVDALNVGAHRNARPVQLVIARLLDLFVGGDRVDPKCGTWRPTPSGSSPAPNRSTWTLSSARPLRGVRVLDPLLQSPAPSACRWCMSGVPGTRVNASGFPRRE